MEENKITYKQFIQKIIEVRGKHGCGNEYHEKHHIVPRCLGGSDDTSNLIDLFAREHYEAHRLLALENPHNSKLQYAWWMMTITKSNNQERYICSPEEYEEAKISLSHIRKEAYSGTNNPFYGKHHNEQVKEKLSKFHKGTEITQQTKEKISSSLKGHYGYWNGKHRDEETKAKISEHSKNKEMPLDLKEKLKEINSVKVKCVETNVIYNSSMEAERNTGIHNSNIISCCRGKRKTAGKYHWQYVDDI